MPFFSICIPNYNYERYIGLTIESVLEQDFQDFEIVVADNASTDESVEIVERYAQESGKIRIFQNRFNVGFAPNLEKAAQPATGRFMLMLSSDDVLLPGALSAYKRVIDALGDAADHTIIGAQAAVIDAEGQPYDQISLPAYYPVEKADLPVEGVELAQISGTDMLSTALRWFNNPLPFATTVYPRALYESVEGYNGTWTVHPDFHFLLKMLTLDPQVIYVRENLAGYRVHAANQTTQQLSQRSLKKEFDQYQLLLEYQRVAQEYAIDPTEMERTLIEGIYLRKGAGSLAQGSWRNAFRLFCLAWAINPGVTAKSPRAYGLMGLLLLGPLGIYAARLLKALRRATGSQPEFE